MAVIVPLWMRSACFAPWFCAINVDEILGRHIRECVDFHHSRKRGACGKAEAVDQPLHHQYAEIHNRLLDGGQYRIADDLSQQLTVIMPVLPSGTQVFGLDKNIQ